MHLERPDPALVRLRFGQLLYVVKGQGRLCEMA